MKKMSCREIEKAIFALPENERVIVYCYVEQLTKETREAQRRERGIRQGRRARMNDAY